MNESALRLYTRLLLCLFLNPGYVYNRVFCIPAIHSEYELNKLLHVGIDGDEGKFLPAIEKLQLFWFFFIHGNFTITFCCLCVGV